MWLTIVCGVPMSGVHKLASSTAQLSSEFIEWQIVESTIDERCTISTAQLARSLLCSLAPMLDVSAFCFAEQQLSCCGRLLASAVRLRVGRARLDCDVTAAPQC